MQDKEKKVKKPKAPDYKAYPAEEDIFRHDRKKPLDSDLESEEKMRDSEADPREFPLEDFDPVIRKQFSTPEDDTWNTENFDTDHSGDDLDIPGGELDDQDENIGREDEENNYYSIGGPRKD